MLELEVLISQSVDVVGSYEWVHMNSNSHTYHATPSPMDNQVLVSDLYAVQVHTTEQVLQLKKCNTSLKTTAIIVAAQSRRLGRLGNQ